MITPEELAEIQEAMNGIETAWNSMVDSAGKVRARAIELGFGPETADQIGMAAFNHVISLTTLTTQPKEAT